MHDVDCVVAGAGVVGLAIARALALSGREVLVVEKAGAIGTGTSSRNSEVIHAGLHYAPGSLKARLCVEGRERLYAYCREHGIAHRRTGKLIVAVEPDQLDRLLVIQANALNCGVGDLTLLTHGEAKSLEQHNPSLLNDRHLHTGNVQSLHFIQEIVAQAGWRLGSPRCGQTRCQRQNARGDH